MQCPWCGGELEPRYAGEDICGDKFYDTCVNCGWDETSGTPEEESPYADERPVSIQCADATLPPTSQNQEVPEV